MLRFGGVLAVLALLLAWAPVGADDLTGANRFVCATTSAVICWDDGTCDTGSPADLDLPQFIEIDLQQKRLSTTKASGLNRSTPIVSIQRDADMIILQGYENGRAFSFLIAEKSGLASVAVVADGRNVAAFGACTPMPSSK